MEQSICTKGLQRIYPLYVVGIPAECVKQCKIKIRIVADNNYFARILHKAFAAHSTISVVQEKITITRIKALLKQQPLICHIDDHALGGFSHVSHFVVLEKELPGDRVLLIDPWTGKQKRLSLAALEGSIHSLKTHIKMCPLLFIIR